MSTTDTTITTAPAEVVTQFVAEFARRDASRLAGYLHPDVVFEPYGQAPVQGRDAVTAVWAGVFSQFGKVEFTTLHQAADGEIVIAEQVHGLGLPGRALAPIRNMAIYRVQNGLITEWRDYTDSSYAGTLL